MKLTKKRIKEILKTLGFEGLKEIESSNSVNEVYHFETGVLQISISTFGGDGLGNIRAELRLLGTGSWDKQYYFTKKKSMFWLEEKEYETIYDDDGSECDSKLIDMTVNYFSEDNCESVGYYYRSSNELHIFENWVPGVVDFKYRDFMIVKKCVDIKTWKFEELGKYYTLKEKGVIL